MEKKEVGTAVSVAILLLLGVFLATSPASPTGQVIGGGAGSTSIIGIVAVLALVAGASWYVVKTFRER